MKYSLIINNQDYSIYLYDSQTSNQLKSLFPLSITMQDLHNNEKYFYFNKPLASAPKTINQIHKGDLMLFQDNCLVLFYKDFKTSYQYTKIGYIENSEDIESIIGKGEITVRFNYNEEDVYESNKPKTL